jgi:hypothetical protein
VLRLLVLEAASFKRRMVLAREEVEWVLAVSATGLVAKLVAGLVVVVLVIFADGEVGWGLVLGSFLRGGGVDGV